MREARSRRWLSKPSLTWPGQWCPSSEAGTHESPEGHNLDEETDLWFWTEFSPADRRDWKRLSVEAPHS